MDSDSIDRARLGDSHALNRLSTALGPETGSKWLPITPGTALKMPMICSRKRGSG